VRKNTRGDAPAEVETGPADPRAAKGSRLPLYTLGHSTRSLEELVAVLREWKVSTLVDIRKFARSRTNPQFDGDELALRLPERGIAYVPITALGGRRGKSTSADPSRNAGWQVSAFHNYADYAETEAFAQALEQLLSLAAQSTCAVLCAEAVWWRCHRRIVADYALLRGLEVFHIFDRAKAQPAERTPFARLDRRRGTLRYPAEPESAGAEQPALP
jgi:uncharacterized protein (DUF488 family)